MASTNQSPEYLEAEKKFLLASSDEERLAYLEEMLRYAPKHKAGESMRANLRTRYKKLREKISKPKRGAKKQGIKKSEMQALLIGMPNVGKSSIFQILTNQETKITSSPFSTTEPKLGSMDYQDVKVQIIDMPPFPNTEFSLINSADTLLIVIDNIIQLERISQFIKNSKAKKIYIFNKSDQLDESQKRKIIATLKSCRLDAVLFSAKILENLQELKKKIFETFPIIRIYTKEPRKEVSKSPMILPQDSTIQDVADKILKGLKIKKAKITGPSSKFPNQIVGISHILKDKDIVELQA